MPRTNVFKQSLAAKIPQVGMWSSIPSPYVVELLAGADFDWLLLDAEHSPVDPAQMLQLLQAADASPDRRSSTVVRVSSNDPVLIKRYLDIGVQSILVPFVQDRAQAEAAVAATRYVRPGIRGVGGSMRASRFGRDITYIQDADAQQCVLVQVETVEALDNLEAIASVAGVDGVFIGPADLSTSMGYPGQTGHPAVVAAIDDAIKRILACDKAPGIVMVDEQRASHYLEIGALFVAVGVDQVILRASADALAVRFRDKVSALRG